MQDSFEFLVNSFQGDRENQRKTERDRERQREPEKNRERQRET